MPFILSTVLLVLAVVLVVLTRMRLAKNEGRAAGRLDIPLALVNAHSVVGGLAIVVWGAYLFLDADWVVGFLGLLLWWGTTAIGLLILMRWMPAKGRHASAGAGDEWTEGPWLSMVAHLGALVGAIVWTTFFALGSLS
jgi:hypothetical protein